MAYFLSRCSYTESYEGDNHTYTFTGPCIVTGKPYSVTVPAKGLYEYHQGAHMQTAFPNLSPEDREFLISGSSPDGWNEMWKEEDDAI